MMRLAAALLALFVPFSPFTSPTAHACGGFFCSQSAPVVQNAERIVFADNGDGTITAVIEIVYSGPSQRFSWVLPVSGTPAIGVASTGLFTALDAQTTPRPNVAYRGTPCTFDYGRGFGCGCGGADTAYSGATGSVAGDSGVAVLEDGSVGPYDYVVISVDPLVADPATTARTWLTSEGYDVSDAGATVLGEYLAAGLNLVAFRLTKLATVGSIRPITMTYASSVGVIPIKPTAVAARNDMGVRVFMLGASRAVPVSYDEIELSNTALDWTQAAASYPDALSAAVDEAGGHAFVTEFAGRMPFALTGRTVGSDARARLAEVISAVALETDAGLMRRAVYAFGGFEGLADALRRAAPSLPSGAITALLQCPSCVFLPTTSFVDRTELVAGLDAYVVAPLESADALLARSHYVTRLSTSIDPAEMTVDPVFAFATGLPDVSNVRNVTVDQACVGGTTVVTDVELADGSRYDPARLSATTPRVERRWDHGIDGSRLLITDNAPAIANAVTMAAPRRTSGGGCATRSAAPGAKVGAVAVVAALVAVASRRTRRRRSGSTEPARGSRGRAQVPQKVR